MGVDLQSDPKLQRLAEGVPQVERALEAEISDLKVPNSLRGAVRYALLGGGKRLRPVLVWQSCLACGGRGPECLPAASTVELIHAFSLVHDDLPAMDDDDMRRGRPTLHVKMGEAMAILAGDLLLAMAFRALGKAGDAAVRGRLVREVAEGTMLMISGQVRDTIPGVGAHGDGMRDDGQGLERLREVHREKTGALIRASCRMGAISAAGPDGRDDDPQLEALTRFGEAVGLMYQVVDDLLDVTQSADAAGKRTGKDAQRGKLTYPGLLGVEGSRAEVRRLRSEALAEVEPLGPAAEGLRELCEYLSVRVK